MDNWTINKSLLDSSVNFIKSYKNGYIETRFVQRVPEYFIAYLSSHSGCNKSCRFCHLTATGQTSFDHIDTILMLEQAQLVIDYYKTLNKKADIIHYNWMARGEPLSNSSIINDWFYIYENLTYLAKTVYLIPKFKISTIMPEEVIDLRNIFAINHKIDIYYSLYSMNPNFRKRWLPKAKNPNDALDILKEFQLYNKRQIVLHSTFIKDQNDDIETIENIIKAVQIRNLDVKFNLVRYNPYSKKYGEESSQKIIDRNVKILSEAFNIKIVPRVGFDVKASCGMFI